MPDELNWKLVKDPIYGYIKFNNFEKDLIDTPIFQRLRNIRQQGMGYLTYPGATHTRFEHSLGVMFLAGEMFDSVLKNSPDFWKEIKQNSRDNMKQTLRCAGILHDIGHMPLSHACESFIDEKKIIDKLITDLNLLKHYPEDQVRNTLENIAKHELMSSYLVISNAFEYRKKLESHGIDPVSVACMIIGQDNPNPEAPQEEHIMTKIINSPLDADKLDYIFRDSFVTGAIDPPVDRERLLLSYIVYQNSLMLDGKALSVIFNLIKVRDWLYVWVYLHHKVNFTEMLMQRIIREMTTHESNPLNQHDLFSDDAIANLVDDYTLINKIREYASTEGKIKKYYSMITHRKFFSSCWKNIYEYHMMIDEPTRQNLITWTKGINIEKFETELSKTISSNDLMVNRRSFKPFTPQAKNEIKIKMRGQEKPKSANEIEREFFGTPTINKEFELPFIYTTSNLIENCTSAIKKWDEVHGTPSSWILN
mgnify:CR=1 FL=1